MENLLSENLIALHEQLLEFAKHHQNKGGQAAHQIIKKKFIDDVKDSPRDGSPDAILRDEGFDLAIKKVLSVLHSTFVP